MRPCGGDALSVSGYDVGPLSQTAGRMLPAMIATVAMAGKTRPVRDMLMRAYPCWSPPTHPGRAAHGHMAHHVAQNHGDLAKGIPGHALCHQVQAAQGDGHPCLPAAPAGPAAHDTAGVCPRAGSGRDPVGGCRLLRTGESLLGPGRCAPAASWPRLDRTGCVGGCRR